MKQPPQEWWDDETDPFSIQDPARYIMKYLKQLIRNWHERRALDAKERSWIAMSQNARKQWMRDNPDDAVKMTCRFAAKHYSNALARLSDHEADGVAYWEKWPNVCSDCGADYNRNRRMCICTNTDARLNELAENIRKA